MNSFQKQLAQVPAEISKAWSVGFVFVKEKDHYWHFPARQWNEQQIQDYFFERYKKDSQFILYPKLGLKQLVINDLPELFVIVPYDYRKDNN